MNNHRHCQAETIHALGVFALEELLRITGRLESVAAIDRMGHEITNVDPETALHECPFCLALELTRKSIVTATNEVRRFVELQRVGLREPIDVYDEWVAKSPVTAAVMAD